MVALATASPSGHLWSPGRKKIGCVTIEAIIRQGLGHSLLAGRAGK